VYGEDALERGLQRLDWVGPRALSHEAVVEHFLRAPAVLPMQMFTLFTGDTRAAEHIMRNRSRISKILSRIQGHQEWGLRLTWDAAAAAADGDRPTVARSASRPGERQPTGAAYLARKRDARDVARRRLKRARAEADRLFRAVSPAARAARRRTAMERSAPASRVLLDAAFLVPTRKAVAFRAAVRRRARTLEGSGIVVSLTGPWPAYNFV
jgi:hypothetical protein